MNVKTDLDQRFSDPDAEATSWERTEQVLAEAQLFWISTVRRDGRPHVTPLVAVWHDGALHFTTGPEEQKAINLTAAEKWDGSWKFEPAEGGLRHPNGGVADVFAVRPSKVLAFGKGRFSHTRHRF